MDSTLTMATVAQNALDATKNGIAELVNAMKAVAPDVWEVIMKQVYMEAVTGLALAIFLTALFLVPLAIFWCISIRRKWDGAGQFALGAITIGVSISGVTAISVTGYHYILVLYNPEYYAAVKLMALAGIGY